MTHELQPLDRSYMFAFKKRLSLETGRHFARQIVGSMKGDLTFTLAKKLAALKPLLCSWASGSSMHLSTGPTAGRTRASAWQRIAPGSPEAEDALL
eukprot:9470762-Pyramimonas_sp.AAC.1